jgi:hypothetical protein
MSPRNQCSAIAPNRVSEAAGELCDSMPSVSSRIASSGN